MRNKNVLSAVRENLTEERANCYEFVQDVAQFWLADLRTFMFERQNSHLVYIIWR